MKLQSTGLSLMKSLVIKTEQLWAFGSSLGYPKVLTSAIENTIFGDWNSEVWTEARLIFSMTTIFKIFLLVKEQSTKDLPFLLLALYSWFVKCSRNGLWKVFSRFSKSSVSITTHLLSCLSQQVLKNVAHVFGKTNDFSFVAVEGPETRTVRNCHWYWHIWILNQKFPSTTPGSIFPSSSPLTEFSSRRTNRSLGVNFFFCVNQNTGRKLRVSKTASNKNIHWNSFGCHRSQKLRLWILSSRP